MTPIPGGGLDDKGKVISAFDPKVKVSGEKLMIQKYGEEFLKYDTTMNLFASY